MGYYLQIDADRTEPLASNTGWGDFCRWVGSLPAGKCMALRALCAHGWTGEVAAAAQGLEMALKKAAPKQADVKTTADGLLKLLTDAKGAEVVSVTDGVGSG